MLGQTPPDEQVPVEKPVPNITYQVGQQVRVRSGAFANFTGEVEDISNDKQKIWLSVSLCGRPTRVEVDFSEVEPVA
jgi:transcriptional antiterminator NusG